MPSSEESLRDKLTRCRDTDDADGYLAAAGDLVVALSARQKMEWLSDKFSSEFARLLRRLAADALVQPQHVLELASRAIDIIGGGSRGRIYLADAHGRRLLCRRAWGAYADSLAREPVTVGEGKWKVDSVFVSGEPAIIRDTQEAGSGCHRRLALSTRLHSCWLFPIFAPGATFEELKIHPFPRRNGVLCVDNPYHDEREQQLAPGPLGGERLALESFLWHASVPLQIARTLSAQDDLHRRVTKLLELNNEVLADRPVKAILDRIFDVAHEFLPNLSLSFVRLLRGYRGDHLAIKAFWPNTDELKTFFDRDENNVIRLPQRMEDAPHDPWLFVDDVMDPDQMDEANVPELDAFVRRIGEQGIEISLGSLVSIRMDVDGGDGSRPATSSPGQSKQVLGVCNFFTRSPRRFLDDEVELLNMLVTQAGVSVRNEQLKYERQRHVDGMKLLRECIEWVEDKDADERRVAQLITQRLCEIFPVSHATCGLYDQTSQQWEPVASWPEEAMESSHGPYEITKGMIGRAIEERKTVVDSLGGPMWDQYYLILRPNLKTSAAFPLIDADEVVLGALVLESEKADAFTREDIGIIETVVRNLPVAVTAARHVRALQKKAVTESMGENVTFTVHKVARFAGPIPAMLRAVERVIASDPIERDRALELLDAAKGYAEQLLEIADRLHSSSQEVGPTTLVKLIDFLRATIGKSESAYHWDDVEIEVLGDASLATLTDASKLQEIVICLVDNAVRAAKKNDRRPSRVELSALPLADSVYVDVADSGRGVPQDIREALCTRMLGQTEAEGTGIGLFISALSARRLGGNLRLLRSPDPRIEELCPGDRTTFRLKLPLRIDSDMIEENDGRDSRATD